jgi:sugar phosphate isomerase/epimerase
VDKTFSMIGPLVRYTHIKDCRHDADHPNAMSDGWRYVAPGTGEIPLRRAVQLLRKSGYDGYLVLEHEKRWHPELPEPEEALPLFVRWARQVLAEV